MQLKAEVSGIYKSIKDMKIQHFESHTDLFDGSKNSIPLRKQIEPGAKMVTGNTPKLNAMAIRDIEVLHES